MEKNKSNVFEMRHESEPLWCGACRGFSSPDNPIDPATGNHIDCGQIAEQVLSNQKDTADQKSIVTYESSVAVKDLLNPFFFEYAEKYSGINQDVIENMSDNQVAILLKNLIDVAEADINRRSNGIVFLLIASPVVSILTIMLLLLPSLGLTSEWSFLYLILIVVAVASWSWFIYFMRKNDQSYKFKNYCQTLLEGNFPELCQELDDKNKK